MNDFHATLPQLTIAGCHSNSLDVSCRFHSVQFASVEDFLSSVFQFFNSSSFQPQLRKQLAGFWLQPAANRWTQWRRVRQQRRSGRWLWGERQPPTAIPTRGRALQPTSKLQLAPSTELQSAEPVWSGWR